MFLSIHMVCIEIYMCSTSERGGGYIGVIPSIVGIVRGVPGEQNTAHCQSEWVSTVSVCVSVSLSVCLSCVILHMLHTGISLIS